MDCAGNVPEDLAEGMLVLVVLLPPEELLRTSKAFLQKLSAILHTTLRFRLDENGEAMIRPFTRKEARLKRELPPQHEIIGSVSRQKNLKYLHRILHFIKLQTFLGFSTDPKFTWKWTTGYALGTPSTVSVKRKPLQSIWAHFQQRTISASPIL